MYGFLHIPVSNKKSIGIVYCHPFAEERNMSHSIAVRMARSIAENGLPVLRFDFSGCGDSEDGLENVSIEDMMVDIHCAVNALKKKTNVSECVIWGLRLGAGLGLIYSKKIGNVAGLILWEPILEFELYIKTLLRSLIISSLTKNKNTISDNYPTKVNTEVPIHETVSLNGYPITHSLYKEFCETGKMPFLIRPDMPIALFSISLMDNPSVMINNYFNSFKNNNSKIEKRHIQAEPFWDRYWRWTCPDLVDATQQWILEHF